MFVTTGSSSEETCGNAIAHGHHIVMGRLYRSVLREGSADVSIDWPRALEVDRHARGVGDEKLLATLRLMSVMGVGAGLKPVSQRVHSRAGKPPERIPTH